MQTTVDHMQVRTLVASTPGGPARQFRVQFQAEGDSLWRKFASFGQLESAESCASDLMAGGISARIVAFRICPTSA